MIKMLVVTTHSGQSDEKIYCNTHTMIQTPSIQITTGPHTAETITVHSQHLHVTHESTCSLKFQQL